MTDDDTIDLELHVNGRTHAVAAVPYYESLLGVLRERLGLRGTKHACDEGFCGACTVQVDGVAINACLELAAHAVGSEVVTIEGHNNEDGTPTPLQQALLDGGDVQCGFCLPGIVMSASAYLAETADVGDDAVREAMSGNLCRCTGYSRIVAAIQQAGSAAS